MPEATQRRITITADEDMDTGFMLADELAPKTAGQRLLMFCLLAASEWDINYDPLWIKAEEEPEGYVWTPDDAEDYARPAEPDEEPTAGTWWVFTNLQAAEADA